MKTNNKKDDLKFSRDSFSENFKEILDLVNETKSIQLSESYRQSILLNFKSKQAEEIRVDKSQKYKYAFILFAMFTVGYLITSQLLTANDKSVYEILVGLNEEEVNVVFDCYDLSSEVSKILSEENSNTIDSIYSKSLYSTVSDFINIESSSSLTSDYEINDVENLLTDDEVDQLYSQLLEKEIL